MNKQIRAEWEMLYEYIYHQEKYKGEFLIALESNILPYCVLLIRKGLLLYVYEKFEQIYKIKKDAFLIKKWNNSSNLKPKKIDDGVMGNFYFANESKDEAIIDFVTKFYSIDHNVKNTFLSYSKAYRDAICHVSSVDSEINEDKLFIFLMSTIEFIKKIEEVHANMYLKPYIEKLVESGSNKELFGFKEITTIEKGYLINFLIELLKNSDTFDKAYLIEDTILYFKEYIRSEHIGSILNIVFENNISSKNQILYARFNDGVETSHFLEKIYDLKQNIGLQKEWGNFLERFNKDYFDIVDKYSWLFFEIYIKPDKKHLWCISKCW